MKDLRHIIVLRSFFVVALVAAVIWIVWLIVTRSASEPVVAAFALPKDHKLAPSDMFVASTKPLIGRYLRAPVEAGTPIAPKMVSQQPSTPIPNSAAAIITLPAAAAEQRKINEGAAVVVRLSTPALDIAGTVVKQDCGDASCVFFVALSPSQGQTLPTSFAGADLVAAPQRKGP